MLVEQKGELVPGLTADRVFLCSVCQGDRGAPGPQGPSGSPGIGLYGPKVSVYYTCSCDDAPKVKIAKDSYF